MDSSKILEGNEECSSNESGWTMYIASPDHEYNLDDYQDEDGSIKQEDGLHAEDDAGSTDTDDSMASDASSGPSHRQNFYNPVGRSHYTDAFCHAGDKNNRKYFAKKHQQQEEKKPHNGQKKAAKDRSGHKTNSAGRSKKKK